VRKRSELLAETIRERAKQLHGIDCPKVTIEIEEPVEEDFRVATNLKRYGFDEKREHQLIENALLGLGSVNQLFAEMRYYDAIKGARESELHIIEAKLNSAAHLLPDADASERCFARVLRAIDFPEFSLQYGERTVDVEALLKAREHPDCLAFRAWLAKSEKLNENEIRDMVGSVTARVGSLLHSEKGGQLRFVANLSTTFADPITSVITSTVDRYIIDKVLKPSGPIAFLNQTYPSLFRQN
jgi:hypothetical protein